MALALSVLGTPVASSTNAASYAHGAVTPAASCGIIVVVGNSLAPADTPTLDTPTWLDGSWTQEVTQDDTTPSVDQRLTIFSGKSVASPGSDTLTASFGGTSQAGCFIVIVQVTGQDTTDFVLQPEAADAGTVASVTATLNNALAASTSVVLGAVIKDDDTVIDQGDGETELYDGGHTAPARQMCVQYKVNDTSTSFSWGATDNAVVAALELVEASGTTTPQSVDASVLATATIPRVANKIASASSLATASIVKEASKLVSASTSLSASILKDVSTSLSSTVLVTATLEAIKVVLLTVAATVTTTATIAKSVDKILAPVVTVTATIVKEVAKSVSAAVQTAAELVPTFISGGGTVFNQAVDATVAVSATMVRSIGKLVDASTATSATIVRSVGKSLSVTTPVAASLNAVKTVVQVLTATVVVASTLVATFVPPVAAGLAKLRMLMGMGR